MPNSKSELSKECTIHELVRDFKFFNKSASASFNFLRSDSDVIAKLKGTFTERPKRLQGTTPGEAKKKKKKGPEGPAPTGAPAARAPAIPSAAMTGGPVVEAPPNQILFLTNLPEETNEVMLQMLFNQVNAETLVYVDFFCTLISHFRTMESIGSIYCFLFVTS